MMLKKQKGFTLIELLIVMIIIGILSLIGVSSFNKYKQKAWSANKSMAARQVQTILELKSVEYIDSFQKYIYGAIDVRNFFTEHSYVIGEGDKYCYVYIAINPNNPASPEWDNQYVLATWNEEGSTLDSSSEGILFWASNHSFEKVKTMINARSSLYYKDSFICDNWQDGNKYLDQSWSHPKFKFRRDWFVNGGLNNSSLRYWHPISGNPHGASHVEMVLKHEGSFSCRHNSSSNSCESWDGK